MSMRLEAPLFASRIFHLRFNKIERLMIRVLFVAISKMVKKKESKTTTAPMTIG